MGAETEEHVNIGFHPLEHRGRPLTQEGAGVGRDKAKGRGPGQTKQGGLRIQRKVGEEEGE